MASDPATLYVVISPIAAAFAGFGSLANSLGQDRGGDHARIDAFRLSTMLAASLSATLLGLLPATLEGLSLGDEAAVRICAVAAVFGIAVYFPIALGQARSIRGLPGFSRVGGVANGSCLLAATVAFALCAIDVWAGRAAGLYLVGLMGLLGSSIVMFWRVIASILRPAHGA